jgi:hypothetical protein
LGAIGKKYAPVHMTVSCPGVDLARAPFVFGSLETRSDFEGNIRARTAAVLRLHELITRAVKREVSIQQTEKDLLPQV